MPQVPALLNSLRGFRGFDSLECTEARADTNDGGSIREGQIHLTKRPAPFRQAEPPLFEEVIAGCVPGYVVCGAIPGVTVGPLLQSRLALPGRQRDRGW